jgi:GNAT superfamily N-acetyltransferase
MSGWRVREAGPADLPALAELFSAHLAEQGAWNPLDAGSRNPAFDSLTFLTQAWAAGVEQFRVAEEAELLLGFIRFNLAGGGPPRDRRGPRTWTFPRLLRFAADRLNRLAERRLEPAQLGRAPAGGYGYIADLYLLPDRRRQGIGSQLVDSARQWFQQQNVEIIYLNVFDLNRVGTHFWTKLGFLPYRHTLLRQLRS